MAKSMQNEAKLTEGMSSNMVKGEPPSPIRTSNGVNKVSCIDPKDKDTPLDGFALPSSLGNNLGDGQCVGAQVIVLFDCFFLQVIFLTHIHRGSFPQGGLITVNEYKNGTRKHKHSKLYLGEIR